MLTESKCIKLTSIKIMRLLILMFNVFRDDRSDTEHPRPCVTTINHFWAVLVSKAKLTQLTCLLTPVIHFSANTNNFCCSETLIVHVVVNRVRKIRLVVPLI